MVHAEFDAHRTKADHLVSECDEGTPVVLLQPIVPMSRACLTLGLTVNLGHIRRAK